MISLEFDRKEDGGFRTDASNWNGIDEFYFDLNTAPSDLKVGEPRHVQVIKVGDSVAKVQNFNPGRNDQLLPSGSLVVDITDRNEGRHSVGEISSFPFIDEVKIFGEVPATVLSVPILAVAPMDGYAVSDVSDYYWPDSGEIIRVFTNQGRSTARSLRHRYEFPIKQPSPITGIAKVETEYEDRKLIGAIQEFESSSPQKEDVISAKLDHSRAENIAWFGEYDDRIEVGEYPPVSGTVQVRITNARHPLAGEVVSGPDSLPSEGENVHAHILGQKSSSYAKPETFDGRIQLESDSDQSGRAVVEITEITDVIKGKVRSFKGSLSKGDTIPVQAARGQAPVSAEVQTTGVPVRIEENVLATGTIDVKITNDDRPFCAVVNSYRGLVPEVGEQVSAEIQSGITISTAKPHHGSYIIYLSDESDYEGPAKVEITDVGNRIEGEIVEQNPVGQRVENNSGKSPFNSGSSRWNITREKM